MIKLMDILYILERNFTSEMCVTKDFQERAPSRFLYKNPQCCSVRIMSCIKNLMKIHVQSLKKRFELSP